MAPPGQSRDGTLINLKAGSGSSSSEGLVLGVRVHSARVPDADGIRLLLESVRARLGHITHLWVDAGYQGRGKRWAEEAMGLSVEVVCKPPKPVPEKVAERWALE